MQDSAQRFDRAVVANARPEVNSSEDRTEELTGLLQSLFETTCRMTVQASAGDFAGIREHFQPRRRILDRVHELMPENGQDALSINNQMKSALRVTMQAAQEENLRILQLIHERKKIVLSKIVEVQNRRHVFDYLR
jgi:hypothetical protein